MSSNKSIAKSAGIIGSATLLSRVLGFVRDIMFAAFFGTGIYAQAFVVAFRIPNLLRDLIGEGATNAAVVPVPVEELTRKGKEHFWRLANILLNILLAHNASHHRQQASSFNSFWNVFFSTQDIHDRWINIITDDRCFHRSPGFVID